MTNRSSLRVLAALAVIGSGPLLGHAAPGILTPVRAFVLASAVCFVGMALSLDVLTGHGGLPSLGHGALLGVGAITSGLATGRWYLPFFAGAALAVVVTATVALVLAVPAVRLGAVSFALVTLALGLVVEQSLFRWRWLTRGTSLLELPRPQVGSFVFTRSADYMAVAAATAVLVWMVAGRVSTSSLGRGLRLLRDDRQAAEAFGIDPISTRVVAFVVSGALAGAAGATFGHLVVTVSAETFRYSAVSLPLLALVVVGGGGSRAGVAVVSFFYAVTPRLLAALRGWDAIAAALLFLVTVVRNPGGLAASVSRSRRRALAPASVDPEGLVAGPLPAVPSTPGGQGTALVVSGLHVEREGVPVLEDVSLSVRSAHVVAIVGPNGAGKTTLLDAVSGFVAVRSGSITIAGTEVLRTPAHARRHLGVGRTFQRLGLPAGLAVGEALLVAHDVGGTSRRLASFAGTPHARRREHDVHVAAERALRRLGLEDHGDVPLGELSVGQRRLVELVAALAGDRHLLLLDEPSAGLAPAAVDRVARQLSDLRAAGHAVVLVEHDLALVREVADEVVVLVAGRVVAHGPAPDVLRDDRVAAAWLGAAL